MTIGINCGHTLQGSAGSGASGFLVESNETRAVGYPLMEILRKMGHTVIDCTDDKAPSVTANLKRICALANAQPLDIFLSIHFNAGGGRGTEVYTYGSGDVAYAGKIKSALYSLGFRDRGIKDGSNLYVIKNTYAPAALLEVCFVDNPDDAELYNNIGAYKIAETIAEAISGSSTNKNKEALTMSEYNELKAEIEKLSSSVNAITAELYEALNPVIYNYIDDNMPIWARETIKKLVDSGKLKGDENGLGLTEDMLRILVILDRSGAFDD